MSFFNNCFNGKKVLITGHTGFKGSWLSMWLRELGADVAGISLDPETVPNHWSLLNLEMTDYRVDIRNWPVLHQTFTAFQPELVYHLAAQPLVRRSYANPIDTWATNVQGTCHVLEACRNVGSVNAIVVVTSDKCYENREWHWGYREEDRLGGRDPYSASKAAAELLVESYRKSFFETSQMIASLATARAGNVIGGGDWSEDRLIPDLIRAHEKNEILCVRSPDAIRPWQHVLESLSGYLLLGQRLLEGQRDFATAWNFGPDHSGGLQVREVLRALCLEFPELRWEQVGTPLHEAGMLKLDSAKARHELKWQPVWDVQEALTKTAQWYKKYIHQGEVISQIQLKEYLKMAKDSRVVWAE